MPSISGERLAEIRERLLLLISNLHKPSPCVVIHIIFVVSSNKISLIVSNPNDHPLFQETVPLGPYCPSRIEFPRSSNLSLAVTIYKLFEFPANSSILPFKKSD